MGDTPTEDLAEVAKDLSASQATARVLVDIAAERAAAEDKFPGQHLPDGTSSDDQAARTRDMYRKICDRKLERGTCTWADVVREEVYEALAETNAAALRAELVQAGAMIVRWIEDIDLRGATAQTIHSFLADGRGNCTGCGGTYMEHTQAMNALEQAIADQDDANTRPAGADQ